MLKNLTIQKRFTLMALLPMVVIAVLAAGAVIFLDAQTGIRPFGIFALAGLILTGIVAVVLTQSIGQTLTETADSARKLAQAQEAVLIGDEEPLDNLAPLPTPPGELGDLHAALNSVQDGSRKVIASQRGAVKEGLANIVVNLARRNQSLLDRQVEFIEKLENNEENPDKLDDLFTVDHLATRMRRNAESLLVLAEAEPGKRRGGPVDTTDVVRVAIGEIEDYQHISLGAVAPGRLSPTNAIDLAHLLAELMENATQSSPPETAVEVYSDQLEEAYVVSVVDFGMGMTDDQRAEANRTLADPPELGLALTRSLGFVVVGRLADRLGATVQLYPSAESGVTAEIVLPNSILLPALEGDDAIDSGKVQFNKSGATAVPKADSPSDDSPTNADDDSQSEQPNSENSPALDRLLGLGVNKLPETESLDPTVAQDWSTRSPFPTNESNGSAALPARGKELEPTSDSSSESSASGDDAAAWTPPPVTPDVATGWTPPPVTPNAPSMTSKLSEALPTGGALEAGMDSLLQSPSDAPAGRLTKRRRTESQAPKSEGREVPESGQPMVAAKNRKPDEIRSMLLQYRAGLKGDKLADETDQAMTEDVKSSKTEQDQS